MVSLNTLVPYLEPLKTLERKAEEFAERCEPDFVCKEGFLEKASFAEQDLDELGLSGEAVVLRIEGRPYLFTDWSRLQLLSHLGTREKWFESVTLDEQARELSRRLPTFEGHVLKRMHSAEEGIGFIRGLVSKDYAEIKDTEVMAAVAATAPDACYLKRASGKSDRAFYAYILTAAEPIGLRNELWGFPGAVFKNSEVGYTSLQVIPFLFVSFNRIDWRPVVLSKKSVFRRIHRGSIQDLKADFQGALDRLADVWGPLQGRLDGLRTRTFVSEDAAIEAMREALVFLKVAKHTILAAEHAYRRAAHPTHNGLAMLQAVLASAGGPSLDSKYSEAEVAGALLLHLL